MPKTDYAKCSNFLKIVFLVVFIPFCTSAPVNVSENAYIQFIEELNRNKCSTPSQVQLPFDSTKVNNFEYLSSYLEICQKTELTKRNKESAVLCKEIFDNIRNISCLTKTALPDITVKLTKNVCKGISALKESVPDDKSLLKRLTDEFLCDIMCDNEFEKACQVLLWSFEVRKLIASVANAQESEQPNVPEGAEDLNDNNAEDESDLPQINVNPENDKKNADDEKYPNEVSELNEITAVSASLQSENNPEQKLVAKIIPSGNGKELVPTNKDAVLGNQTDPNSENLDIAAAAKSTNDLKSSNSLSRQVLDLQPANLDTKVIPIREAIKGEFNVQNGKVQSPSDVSNMAVVQQDKVNVVDRPSQGSNTNVAINEQTQDSNANTHSKSGAQNEKNANILTSENLHHFNVPATKNVSLNVENNPDNEIDVETHKKDQDPDSLKTNEFPHRLENERNQNDAAADLHSDGQSPLNSTYTLTQSRLLSTASSNDNSTKKVDTPSTGSQTIKDTTKDKTSIAGKENKTDQSQSDSASKKGELQDHINAEITVQGLISDDGTRNDVTDQKPEVSQQTKDSENTIPDPTKTSTSANENQSEKNQKIKAIVISPESKNGGLAETSTKITVTLEKMEGTNDLRQPADDGADHFEDMENTEDEEYSRSDYDGLYEVSKNKESNPNVPSPITIAKEIITNQNEMPIEFPSRNSFGQDTSDIQMIAAFPEQEDSHFFFYFLSIVLILMAGYLLFHNKQKIIALIVEGRHERNRRSHRIGYKKLETK